nr:MAG TPA: hypothetical protein [Caudoviricetes sp.]
MIRHLNFCYVFLDVCIYPNYGKGVKCIYKLYILLFFCKIRYKIQNIIRLNSV